MNKLCIECIQFLTNRRKCLRSCSIASHETSERDVTHVSFICRKHTIIRQFDKNLNYDWTCMLQFFHIFHFPFLIGFDSTQAAIGGHGARKHWTS
jgi:hypothetical protein